MSDQTYDGPGIGLATEFDSDADGPIDFRAMAAYTCPVSSTPASKHIRAELGNRPARDSMLSVDGYSEGLRTASATDDLAPIHVRVANRYLN